jgi:hypothetical protein
MSGDVAQLSGVCMSMSSKGAILFDDHFALCESPLQKCVIRGCARRPGVVQTSGGAALVRQSTTDATAAVTVATPVVETVTNRDIRKDRKGGAIRGLPSLGQGIPRPCFVPGGGC